MKLTKPIKILVGILTFINSVLPFLIAPVMMLIMFSFGSSFPLQLSPDSPPDSLLFVKFFFPMMLIFFPLTMCIAFMNLGLQVFYLIFIIKNTDLSDSTRIIFAIGVFLMPIVLMPVYYLMYLWKDKPGVD